MSLLGTPGRIASVAVLGAAFVTLLLLRSGSHWPVWAIVPVLAALAMTIVTDASTKRIPDAVTLPGIAYALAVSLAIGRPSPRDALVGGLLAGGLVLAAAIVSRGAIGGGDVKLVAMLGLALGWGAALAVLALSQVIGALFALGRLAVRRRLGAPLPIGALIGMLGALALIFR